MTFEESVRDLMRTWPSLYYTRALALDALFMGYGNGTYWNDDGAVANIYADDDRNHPLVAAKEQFERGVAEVKENGTPEFRERDLEWKQEFYENKIATIKDVLNNLEERASGCDCEIDSHFYPLHKGGAAPIQNIPDGCPADWVLGAREMCALVLACSFEETEDGNLARNKRIARKTIKDLDKRFGKAPLPDVSYATWKEKMPWSEVQLQRKQIRAALKEMGI